MKGYENLSKFATLKLYLQFFNRIDELWLIINKCAVELNKSFKAALKRNRYIKVHSQQPKVYTRFMRVFIRVPLKILKKTLNN